MQSVGGFSMDPDLLASRKKVQEIIYQSIMNGRLSNSSQNTDAWKPRAAEITKKLEELIFKDAVSKEDYMSMTAARIEQHIFNIMKNVRSSNQQSSHRISSSSSMNTMMPTPGMAHNASGLHSVVPADNLPMNNTNIASNMVQNTNANVSVGAANSSLYTANGTNNLHSYRQTSVNVTHGTGGNSSTMQRTGVSHELSQMIPTPGLSSNNNNNNFNSQPMSSNSELSAHGQSGGLSSMDTSMVAQQQKQQPYVSSQNSRMMQGFGGQRGAQMRPNMQQNAPTFGLSNIVSNASSMGLTGSSSGMPAANRLETQDVYPNNAYATFNRQQHQQNIQPPSSQHQLLPMAGHGYSGGNMYGSGSSYVSTLNNNNSHRINSMNMHAKPKTNHAVPTHHNSSMQQQQQPSLIKPQLFDSSQQQMNLSASQTPQEYQMHAQNQMQNVQHQPSQQPLEPTNHERSVQKQQQQYVQNQQQFVPKTEILRQNTAANFGGRSAQDHHHQQPMESFKESFVSHPTQQLHMSESENQYQHINNNDDNIGNNLFKDDTQFLSQFPGSQDFQTSYSHGSQYMLHDQPLAIESQNEFSSLMNASQSDAFHQQNWQPEIRQQNDSTGDSNFLCDQQQQQQLHVVNNGHIEVQKQQQSHISSNIAVLPHSLIGSEDLKWKKQRKWLLMLLHSHKCSGSCKYNQCVEIQELWLHMDKCKPEQLCDVPRCIESKAIIRHFTHCSIEACPVCIPVKKFAALHRKALDVKKIESRKPVSMDTTAAAATTTTATTDRSNTPSIEPNSIDAPQPSPKRMKIPKQETSPSHLPYINMQASALLDSKIQIPQQSGLIPRLKPEPSVEVKINPLSGVHHTNFGDQLKKENSTNPMNIQNRQTVAAESMLVADEQDGHVKQELFLAEKDKNKLVKVETKLEVNVSHPDPVSGSKSGKPKVKGVSMTELFTPQMINDHIISLRKWVGQSKAKVEKNQALERSMTENSCQLCAAEKLTFDPPPIYCTPCGARIKRNAMYYTIGSGDTRHYFCIPCYNETRGDSIQVDGSVYPKSRLEKKKNDEETEEWWVQCDKCEAWQHQICALFNGRRNDGGQAEYTCPNCYVLEIENRERMPLPQNAVLGAKDLPRTILSDHIEQRLFRRLKQEKQERARHLGKSITEIPGADSLVVRVVSSVDKKLEVKQRFLEIFQEDNYPAEFPYKSKVVLLFQNIEGVEVCLFGMYVQEFGSECQFPNQRRVYLSYLDSVKYFRPDVKTVTGEALRTFVYHEILIAYLEYCKKRGFTSCYIWACPPLKGEDYILYCHPEIQKTPKSDKLREWYLAMLRKAAKESIVVELTNLYDHFFTTTGECKAKVTAARLPYFDGDYWPGAAEDMINQLRLEEDGRKLHKKGKTKKLITKRALKAAGQIDISGNASKDALLMQKLGETIYPMKEDFIMVHLQHSCTHCCLLMVSGTRWVCNKCKNFQLCEKCYDTEQRLDVRERHPVNSREKHDLCPVEITGVSSDTKDKDEILESEFFDTRQAFLSLCQGNHYQYDTLRRAKHSSMMMLYHLHNPTAPAFVTTCNVCLHDVEAGQGWRCEICPDFDVCNACYKKDGGVDHPHKLTNYPTTSERDAQNQEARQKRVVQLRKMLELLVHASQCRYPSCQYPNCRKVKGLFRHGIQCKTRASGGCVLCKKMWYLLQLHARACKESECHVPRCKDLKDHLKRLQQQSDSRRRAAVMEMMRQRYAEVAGVND